MPKTKIPLLSTSRSFRKDQFDLRDEPAKKAARAILEPMGYEVQNNPKRYEVDLLVFKDGEHLFNLEVEVKSHWGAGAFQYGDVQICERKQKYAMLDKPTYFMMFNRDLTQYLVIKDKDLLKSPLKEVPNKRHYSGEYFFKVPVAKITFNKFEHIKG